MSKRNQKPLTEEQIAKALISFRGLQSRAAEALNVGRSDICMRIQGSKYLQEVMKDIDEKIIDDYEDKLRKMGIEDDNITAVIFFLKTKGRERGYDESPPPKGNGIAEELIATIKGINVPAKPEAATIVHGSNS